MVKEKILSASIVCLAISIIISSLIISNAVKENGSYISGSVSSVTGGLNNIGSNLSSDNVVAFRNTLDIAEASVYLGISETSLIELVNTKDSGIPYIKTAGGYVFGKDALDKWLETARVELN